MERVSSEDAVFPATVLFNESWMLRLLLDELDRLRPEHHAMTPKEGARWYSEALLPSQFLPTSQRDPLGETWTHADAAIGHFEVGTAGKTDLALRQDATQLVVVEAKIFSRLSPGVSNAKYYDQAARTVACIAELLHKARLSPSRFESLAFFVVAPQSQINAGVFGSIVTHESVRSKVERRVSEYEGTKDAWFEGSFLPVLERVHLECVSWEGLIQDIINVDERAGADLSSFYRESLRFNAAGG